MRKVYLYIAYYVLMFQQTHYATGAHTESVDMMLYSALSHMIL
jgi:hypothetical protein